MSGEDRIAGLASDLLSRFEGCPSAEELLSFSEGSAGGELHRSIRDHVEACGICADALSHLRIERSVPGPAGRMPAAIAERSDLFLESLTGLDPSAVPSGTEGAADGGSSPPGFSRMLRLAAMIFLTVAPAAVGWTLIGERLLVNDLGVYRSANAIEIVSPEGELTARPTSFRWRGLQEAARYRVELFDRDMERVWEAQTRSTRTSLDVPAEGSPFVEAGTWYTWQVTALGELGEELARSPAGHFILRPKPAAGRRDGE